MSKAIIKFDRRAIAKLGIKGTERLLLTAGEYLRGKVVANISTPTSTMGPSRPGQYPHADTGRLRQSVFCRTGPGPMILGVPTKQVVVGTNVLYGLQHEYQSGRSFLRRTLNEEMGALRRYFRGATVSRG